MDNKLLNEWKIVNRCNDGDFSVVYKATNNNGDICAIKEMNLPRTQDDMEILINAGIVSSLDEAATFFAQAVKNELDLMRKFKGNVNILELYDFTQEIDENRTNAKYYIRMEYAEDIKSYFERNGVSQKDVVKLGIDICTALELFYNHNITHNDIKPGNIFIDQAGNYKIGDFGIATKLGGNNFVPFGTLNYISPEVYNRKGSSNNSDLYSLGLVMYKLLSGELPFVSDTITQRKAIEMRMSGIGIPTIDGVDYQLMNIITKACDMDSTNRYANVIEMKNELMALTDLDDKKKNIVFSAAASEATVSIYDNELLKNQKIKIKVKNQNEKYKRKFDKQNIIKKSIVIAILLMTLLGGIQIYRLNRTCPAGKINKYGKCVSGYFYCDKDYFLKGKKCLKIVESTEAKATFTCKAGYTLNEDMCINNDIREPKPILKCAVDGYTLNTKTNKCEMTISGDAAPQLNCTGNDCLIESNKSYSCTDPSYRLEGTKCTKGTSSTVPAERVYSCGEGGQLAGTICNYTIAPTTSGGMWWGGGMPTCSKGQYNYQDRMCHYSEQAKSSYKCSKGTYDGKYSCVVSGSNVVDAKVEYSCNKGYALVLDSNMCAKTTNVTKYVCPDNAVLRGTKCYTTTTMDAINFFECDEGFVLAGTSCVKNEEVKAVKKYTCSKVYTLNGDKCEKYNEKPAKAHYNK